MPPSLPSHIGPFQVIRQLGRGSNGAVYLARRGGKGDLCALKLLLHADSEGQARFDLEAAISGRLQHPRIVGAFETGLHEGRYKWIAMEYVQGETLQDRLTRGPLQAQAARRLFGDMAEALAFAHERGVIHRDLKPANILIDEDGGAHLTDFGLARTLNSNLTRAGDMIGTPYYMSPEQIDDPRAVDARADVYALGVMLYESLAGERPFEGKTIPEVTKAKRQGRCAPLERLAPDAPPDLVATCKRAMALIPADRYATVAEFAEALDGAGPSRAPSSATPTLVVVAILSVTTLFLVGAYARWRAREQSHHQVAEVAAQALASSREALLRDELSELPALLQPVQGSLPAEHPVARLIDAQLALAEGDTQPAALLLGEADGPEAQAPDRAALERALQLHAIRRTAAAADPDGLPALVDSVDQLDPPAPPALRDHLAEVCVGAALEASRQRASFEVPLALFELAEQTASSAAQVDAARLARGDYLFRRGRFDQARDAVAELVRQPGDVGLQARYLSAFGLLWLERTQEGLEALRAVWEDDPEGVVGQNAGAVFNSYTGKNDIGERLALASLELDPDYVNAWISLTFCRNDLSSVIGRQTGSETARLDKLEEALEANDRAMALQPDHPRVWMSRAFVLGNMGEVVRAIEAYDEVIALTEPRPFARALRHRAKHLAARSQLARATLDLNRAIEQNPADVEALVWRGVLLDMQGDRDGADQDWIRAARTDGRLFQQHASRLNDRTKERIRALFSRR